MMGSVAQYRCDRCGMDFPSLAELEAHNRTSHPD
jgi:hypothetical protein